MVKVTNSTRITVREAKLDTMQIPLSFTQPIGINEKNRDAILAALIELAQRFAHDRIGLQHEMEQHVLFERSMCRR